MLINTSKFFEDNKIALARRECAIYKTKKNLQCLLHQISREIIILLFNKVHKKITKSQDRRNFESVCALFVILHSCYNFAFVFHEIVLSQLGTRSDPTFFFHVYYFL